MATAHFIHLHAH
ncbi:hypothetical protein A2U01_0110955, partial [Trifolium medium]|nr:hypothetical protein [Trifolium medium]